MRELTNEEMEQVQGGDLIGCFMIGMAFGVAVGIGSIPAALASGYFLAENCFS